MLDTSTQARIIKRALEILKTDGWTKGSFENKRGEHCALGALDKASSEILTETNVTPFQLESEFLATLQESGNSVSVITYNDAPERTFEEVISLFRNTLRRVKEGA